jgi:mannose-6-phosphate isomerase-like protein (cupin superfamily)
MDSQSRNGEPRESAGPFDLNQTRVVMTPQGAALPKAVTPDFYREIDAEFDGFAGHVLISRHEFDTAWAGWEAHPHGDEVVVLLSGDIDFVLWREGKEQVVRVNQPGSYIVVPRGVWHTARPRRPTAMLFFTPGEGTLHGETPG